MKVVLNPKHFRVRLDRNTGHLWLTHEKYGQPVRTVKDLSDDVFLGLCADLTATDGTTQVHREVWFAEKDGQKWGARITVEAIDAKQIDN